MNEINVRVFFLPSRMSRRNDIMSESATAIAAAFCLLTPASYLRAPALPSAALCMMMMMMKKRFNRMKFTSFFFYPPNTTFYQTKCAFTLVIAYLN